MGAEFTPIFLFLIVAIVIGASMMIASAVLGPQQDDRGQADAVRVGHGPDRRCPAAVRRPLLSGGDRLPAVRRRAALPLSLGRGAVERRPRRPSPPRRRAAAAGRRGHSRRSSAAWSSGRSWSSSSILAAAFAYAWRKGVFEWR